MLGEAGMGKSMLADWLVSQAEQAGVRVARSACSAAGMLPLWPWRRSLTAIGLELPWREDRATAGLAGREVMAAVALTRELAYQWGGRGVRVNALAPSFFPSATTGWLEDPDQVAWISANTPLGRPPRPGELDGPLLFLASDASSYVTGQTLYVDGG
jgi:Enoyl-(Acyl carrier protein) reductase